MPRKRNSKARPSSPERIAAEQRRARIADYQALDLQPEAATLPSNENVQVRRDGQKTTAGARRLDAFDALKADMEPGAYDAVRQLEADLLKSRGLADRGRSMDRVDSVGGNDELDARIAAGDRVAKALSAVGARDGWLLVELIAPSATLALKAATWRDIVAHVTGETHTHAQAAAVRAACANLNRAQRGRVRERSGVWWQAEGDWKENTGAPEEVD